MSGAFILYGGKRDMAIFKVNRNKDYTIISNYHLKDMNLSLKAKGLLSVMLSLPENWDYSINGLVAICKECETAITNTLNELKKTGYLEVIKLMPNQSKNGRIDYVYNVYEKPKQEGKKQGVENLGLEFLGLENKGQLNTNNKILKNKDKDFKDLKENKEEISLYKYNSKEKDFCTPFDRFWAVYPKKQTKADSKKWFAKNKPSNELVEKMITAINEFKETEQWSNMQFIPMPYTWLNQHRWEDDISSMPKHVKTKQEKINEMNLPDNF